MKTILLSALCLFLIVACSDNEKKPEIVYDPPELAQTPDIVLVVPTAAELADMENTVSEEIDYSGEQVTAYPLGQFVTVTHPRLYGYEVMSDDEDGNWTPRIRGLAELLWVKIEAGYLVPSKAHRTYFPDEAVASAYNVKSCGYLNLYRHIDVINEGTVARFQLGALDAETINYVLNGTEHTGISGIPVSSLISDYVTTTKDKHSYLFTTVTANNQDYLWSQMQRAYIVEETVLFLDAQNTVTHQEEHVISVTLIPDSRF